MDKFQASESHKSCWILLLLLLATVANALRKNDLVLNNITIHTAPKTVIENQGVEFQCYYTCNTAIDNTHQIFWSVGDNLYPQNRWRTSYRRNQLLVETWKDRSECNSDGSGNNMASVLRMTPGLASLWNRTSIQCLAVRITESQLDIYSAYTVMLVEPAVTENTPEPTATPTELKEEHTDEPCEIQPSPTTVTQTHVTTVTNTVTVTKRMVASSASASASDSLPSPTPTNIVTMKGLLKTAIKSSSN